MKSKGFWTLRCKNCGQWFVKEVRKDVRTAVAKCRYCNKNYKLRHKDGPGISLKHKGLSDTEREAVKKVQYLNAPDFLKEEMER